MIAREEKDVSLGDCQIPVLKGAERRKARHSCAEEWNVLIGVGKKEFYRQAIGRAQIEIEVGIELVFIVVSRHHRGIVDTAPRGLRARDNKCSIGVLRVQQIERYWIDIRAVGGYGYTSKRPGLRPRIQLQERPVCAPAVSAEDSEYRTLLFNDAAFTSRVA